MQFNLPLARIVLYCVLAFFSFVLFCICAARIDYTTHIHPKDPLNGRKRFHDPVVALLLVTTLATMPWSLFAAYTIHYRYEDTRISTFMVEAIAMSVLWLFWIVGSSIASSMWGNLAGCQQFSQCRLLSALVAMSWLGWIALTILLGFCLLFSIANRAFMEPLHGRWNPRDSVFGDSRRKSAVV